MRTYLLAEINRKLSTVDRNLAQLMFISEQFLIDNRSRIDSEPYELTRNVHSNNPFRNEFNYRLQEIPGEVTNLRLFTYVSAFVLACSIYEIYLLDLLQLVQQICDPLRARKDDESLIEYLFIVCLNTTIKKHFAQEEIDTLDYIRIRRNVLVHAEGRLSPPLEKLRKRGAKLNSFWQYFGLREVDFTSRSVDKFSADETIDLVRLIRNLSSKIDNSVLESIGKQRLLDYAISDFKSRFGDQIVNQHRNKVEGRFLRDIRYRFDLQSVDVNLSTISF
jgi:hypothetical protein